MSAFITSVLALIVTLGLLIAFHEFGHYWTARKLGVKVLRFSIGFGKPLWSRRYGPDDTEYVIAVFPLGGYVKMLDERAEEVPESERHRAFNNQSVWRRIAIVVAGPVFNFIFAIIAFWLMYMLGVQGMKPVIGEVTPSSIAAEVGFRAGDEIVAIDDRATPTWGAARITLLDKALDQDSIELRVRDNDGYERQLSLPVSGIPTENKQEDLLRYVGITPWRMNYPPVLGELTSDGAALKAGLQSGDRILSTDGEPITDWMSLVEFVRAHPQQTVKLQIERDGLQQTVEVHIASRTTDSGVIGRIGAGPAPAGPLPEEMQAEIRFGPISAVAEALSKTWQMSSLTLRMIGKMIVGEVSVENLSGPITIATYAGYSASVGITSFLYFLAIISISLGVLNLLPIPLLDGGHLMYYLVEIVKGSPVSDAVQMQFQRLGIALLAMLMLLAFYNDFNRLWGG
ncbi:Intramembrane protease RasP/YluC, implicated in cell division based on FtsL cleavage [hydrothermal vent metagenome]|uniref:Intramembrane protease RasP/YluC, implicated in cell division based on FtsL cleavage n=1 Tax=hydrothermal vent metagenome TaxID=652676 RepID=A0A3B0ZPA2_9ZZZZ